MNGVTNIYRQNAVDEQIVEKMEDSWSNNDVVCVEGGSRCNSSSSNSSNEQSESSPQPWFQGKNSKELEVY